jgi:hypothetical protein
VGDEANSLPLSGLSSLVETVSKSAAVIPERKGVCKELRRCKLAIELSVDLVPGDESTSGLRISVGEAASEIG